MSDLVEAVLQLSSCSARDDPAQPLAVGLRALGGGIFNQALGDELPCTKQIPIFNLEMGQKQENWQSCQRLRELYKQQLQ